MRQTDLHDFRRRERELNVRLGATIRRRRKTLGYSIDAVAAAVGTSAQTISRYELGETPMSAARLASVSHALNMEPALALAEAGLRRIAKVRHSDTGDSPVGLHALISDFMRLQTPAARRLACEAVRKIADTGPGSVAAQNDWRGGDQHI